MLENKKLLAAYLTVCILWGSTYLAIKVGIKTFKPEVMGSIRFIIIGTLLMVIVKARKMNTEASLLEKAKISLSGIIILFVANMLLMHGEKEVHSGITSIIVATVPLFIAIMEFITSRENRLTGRAYLGLLVGFGGVFYLVYSSSETLKIDLKSFLLILTSSMLWSGGTVYFKNIGAKCSSIYMASIQNFSAGLCFLLVVLMKGSYKSVTFNPYAVAALSHLVFCGIVAYSAYLYLMKEMSAAKVGTYAYVNPVIAILLGFIVLGETINLQVICSMIIILIGVYMVQSAGFKSKEAAVKSSGTEKQAVKKDRFISY